MTRCSALLALLIVGGCEHDGIQTAQTDNPEMTVTLLFRKDGCNVYRFKDSELRYFVTCPSQPIAATTVGGARVSCGKSCTKFVPSDIQTLRRPPDSASAGSR